MGRWSRSGISSYVDCQFTDTTGEAATTRDSFDLCCMPAIDA